jgi:hypothetical protein
MAILGHFFRRVWWRFIGSPQYRTEAQRRQSWQHVPLQAVRNYLVREEQRRQRREGHVVEMKERKYHREWGAR